ncbi:MULTISPECIES: Rnf-Nqr domain containing protein [unclassified Pseudomonas]|uniref:Rnf-Nqr domain containing protein n=1 Tax=unclassified Pseudomonas TaxID=196821 RepID=UPI00244A0174|nr:MULTISPECIES: Rnf-Nqr domain containing protein [unclassified Pseudomonas]MDG9927234.1 NADH:quinone oxidoreductase [Pseudomonas sp. GD04042]MDH0485293.1 NADH:quinone oxidoreductase [Pseudomonas sp. GD04015]MDH0602656.1 NADH:quinone oxidoreductase [Pseudomonas sp. GD03869]
MTDFLFALIGAALVSNLILGLPLAADALRHARVQALGPAGALLILFAAPVSWLVQQALSATGLAYLHLLACLPLLAGLGWLSLALLARLRPALDLTGLWPLLLGNGLGAMVLATTLDDFASSMALGIGGGLGFWLVLQLMSDLIERTGRCDVPAAFRGAPILLVVAGLTGLAFLGFGGLGAA